MKATFGYGRSQLPFSLDCVTVSGGGTVTTPATLYLAISAQTPVGLNLLSQIIGPITVASGQKLIVTVPATSRNPGEFWSSFVVSASINSSPSNFTQIAKLPNYTLGGATTLLPATVTFSTDESLKLSQIVATAALLPSSPIHGMLRGVQSIGSVFEFDQYSLDTVNGITVLAGSSGVGRWHDIGTSFSSYIASINDLGGCGATIDTISAGSFVPPRYAADGSSGVSQRYWMINDLSQAEPSGRRIGLVVQLNEETKTDLFDGLLRIVFRGYVDTTTGNLRTTYSNSSPFPLVDQDTLFQARKSNLVLPDDLKPNEAVALDIYPNFSLSDIQYRVGSGSIIKIYPFFYQEAGDYSEAGVPLGNLIYPTADRRLIVPSDGLSVQALEGSGMVNSYSFPIQGVTTVYGLVAQSDSQIISINGNGAVGVKTLPLVDTEAIRAFVSTVEGTSVPSNWSAAIALQDNSSLDITCNYPCDTNGTGTIRADYPDKKIAGRTAKFNPSSLTIYIKRGFDNQIRSFEAIALVVGDVSQELSIVGWGNGIIIQSIPSPTDSSFGLFSPGTCSFAEGLSASDFVAGIYSVSYAFNYTKTVTSVSHDEARGCIYTQEVPLVTSLLRTQYWAEAVATRIKLQSLSQDAVVDSQQRWVEETQDYYRFDKVLGQWVAVRSPTIVLNEQTTLPIVGAAQAAIFLSSNNQISSIFGSDNEMRDFAILQSTESFLAGQSVTPVKLTSAGAIAVDVAQSNRFTLLLSTNAVMSVVNLIPGVAFEIEITQASPGGFNIQYSSVFKWVNDIALPLSTAPGSVDVLACVSYNGANLRCGLTKGYS